MQTILVKTKRRAREEEKEDKELGKRKEKREGKNEVRNGDKEVRMMMRRGDTGPVKKFLYSDNLGYITLYYILYYFLCLHLNFNDFPHFCIYSRNVPV